MKAQTITLSILILLLGISATLAASSVATTPEAKIDSNQPTPPPAPKPTAVPSKAQTNVSSSKALIVHKPMPSPSWGRVIQYHREQILALTEQNRETLYEFVFQDDEGIIRTGVFHESANGDGYWEVLVWDQQ